MRNDEQVPTLAEVIGRNIRALRLERGERQDDLARAAREAGLPWDRATVAAIETGGRTVPIGELVLLAGAVFHIDARDLLSGEGWAQVTPESRVKLPALRQLFSEDYGKVRLVDVDTPGHRQLSVAFRAAAPEINRALRAALREGRRVWPEASALDVAEAREAAMQEAEQKAARKLRVNPRLVALASLRLWKRSLTDERDERTFALAPPDATPRTLQAIRGHVTRQLLEELEPLLRKEKG